MTVLVDSSAVLALLNRCDHWHRTAVEILQQLVNRGAVFIMTNFLLAEAHALILTRLGREIARQWLLTFDWNLIAVAPGDERHAIEIIRRYEDKDFSLTDATSFAVMQRHGIELAFTFDRHFKQYGLAAIGRPE
ncbi:MAG TPA: PIN domain-containing protein [Bacillota bacterium]|nr:PIN domain-containing protein [Bacillota bacterium]